MWVLRVKLKTPPLAELDAIVRLINVIRRSQVKATELYALIRSEDLEFSMVFEASRERAEWLTRKLKTLPEVLTTQLDRR